MFVTLLVMPGCRATFFIPPLINKVDLPLTYADYYFVEAMLRYRQLSAR
jgi:hypothetical protein